MERLTSRKLVAAIAGMVAIGTVVLLVGVFPDASEFADKALVALGAITLTAIGAQAVIDNTRGG